MAFDTTHHQWPEGEVVVDGPSSLLITIIDDDKSGPPAAPRYLQVTEGDSRLDLSWDAPLMGEATGYDVQYSRMYDRDNSRSAVVSDPDDGWVQVERSGAGTSQAITEQLKTGIMHWVRVRATNAHGSSAWVSGMGRPAAGAGPAPDYCGQSGGDASVVWRSTMTVGSYSSGSVSQKGFRSDGTGALTGNSFSYGGRVFTINRLVFQTHQTVPSRNNILTLTLRELFSDDLLTLALQVDGKAFYLADSTMWDGYQRSWSDANLSWEDGQEVEVYLRVPCASLSSIVVHYDGDPPAEDFRRWQPARMASYGHGVIIPDEFISIGPDRRTVLVTHAKVKVGAPHAVSTVRVSRITYSDTDDTDPGATPPVACTPRPSGRYQCVAFREVAIGQLSHAIELNAHIPNTGVYIEVTDGSVVKKYFLDIDPPPRTYSLSPGASVVEGHAAPLTLTLSREAPQGGVAFTVSAAYGTAGSGDVGTITSPVTVPAGAASLELSVPTVDDDLDEPDETFTVTVAPVRAGWAVTPDATATATVTIIDNDTAGVTVSAAGTLAVTEDGTATDTVVLDSRPTSAVSVIAVSGDAGAAAVSPAQHIIAPSAWNAPVTFTVSGVADDDGNDETVTITHRVSSQDTGYRNVPVSTVQLEVSDTTEAKQQGQDPANNAPTVASAIADATIVNETGTRQISLTGVFEDADGDSLTMSAASSNNAVATVSVSGDYATLTVAAKSRGTATITVTANDGNGGSVSDTFTVTVKAAPVVAGALADVTGLAAGTTRDVSLSGVFTDADGDSLTITAASSSDAIATVSVAADYSTLTVEGVGQGTATVTVTAQDPDGNTVSDPFSVSVVTAPEPANNAPTVAAAIGNETIVNESGTRQVSLSGVFEDADGDALTVTAGSSNGAVATVSVSADYSNLTVSAQSHGTATITVTAADGNGGTVSDSFSVRVKTAPEVAALIGDVGGLTAGTSRDISLSVIFTDADGDALTITASSSNDAIATATVSSTGSSLTVSGVAEGTATITVTAEDPDGNRVSDAFDVSVDPETEEKSSDGAPTVVTPLPDLSLVGPEERAFDLTLVFQDPDGDKLTFSATSTNARVETTLYIHDSTLTVRSTGTGTATITVTAEDPDGHTVSDSFQVTVEPRVE